MDKHRFETLSDFVAWLTAPERWGQSPLQALWFRGHPDRSLPLIPSVLREEFSRAMASAEPFRASGGSKEEKLEAAEIEMNKQFRREAAALLSAETDLTTLYLLARHHGLPTRMLDWTTNGLAALFFTCVKEPENDGEVIVAAPDWRLTTDDGESERVAALADAPFPQRHELVRQTVAYLFGEGERPEQEMIVPVLPDLRSLRMLHQGSCFTFHLPGSGGIHEKAVTRFVIPKEKKQSFVTALRNLGINWSTLFHDLDHLCQEIRARWERPAPPTR
jgi:hypothetical protein